MIQLALIDQDPGDWQPSSRESDECYTPRWLLEAAQCAMGGEIETDPCWSPASLVRPTRVAYDWRQEGEHLAWYGRTWVNPPYSDPSAFMRRAVAHDAPTVVLCKLDPTTGWWATAMRGSPMVCMLRDRIRFLGDYASGGAAAFPCALLTFRCPSPLVAFRHVGWLLT